MEIVFFDRNVENFMERLEKKALAKTLRTLDLLEKFEHGLGMPQSKRIDRNLFELRVRSIQEVRIIYAFAGKSIVLLCGFLKKSNRIPRQHIILAKRRLNSLEKI